jgi:hypothetical protein
MTNETALSREDGRDPVRILRWIARIAASLSAALMAADLRRRRDRRRERAPAPPNGAGNRDDGGVRGGVTGPSAELALGAPRRPADGRRDDRFLSAGLSLLRDLSARPVLLSLLLAQPALSLLRFADAQAIDTGIAMQGTMGQGTVVNTQGVDRPLETVSVVLRIPVPDIQRLIGGVDSRTEGGDGCGDRDPILIESRYYTIDGGDVDNRVTRARNVKNDPIYQLGCEHQTRST